MLVLGGFSVEELRRRIFVVRDIDFIEARLSVSVCCEEGGNVSVSERSIDFILNESLFS